MPGISASQPSLWIHLKPSLEVKHQDIQVQKILNSSWTYSVSQLSVISSK